MSSVEQRKCIACHEMKNASDFKRNKSSDSGLTLCCTECIEFLETYNHEKMDPVETGGGAVGPAHDLPCPCCGSSVKAPDVNMIIEHYKITHMQSRILRAVWRGNGYPVSTERIFFVMYEDDINGGPTPLRMYGAFKVCLHKLRTKLEGSGISVVNAGKGRGYQLKIGVN